MQHGKTAMGTNNTDVPPHHEFGVFREITETNRPPVGIRIDILCTRPNGRVERYVDVVFDGTSYYRYPVIHGQSHKLPYSLYSVYMGEVVTHYALAPRILNSHETKTELAPQALGMVDSLTAQ